MEGENDPDWQLLKYKAREVYEKGEYDKAEELLTDAIKYMPEAEPGPAASLLGFRGTVYTKMNKLDLAIKDANAGLKICSSSFSCLRCRGMANYLLERWVDAREDLMAAELIMPDESRMIPNLVKEIGAKIAKVKAETFPHFEDRRNRFLEEARNKILTWRESLGSREPLEPPLDVYIDWRDAPVLTPIRMQGFGSGSCGNLQAAASVEAAVAIGTKGVKRMVLSIQQTRDCAKNLNWIKGSLFPKLASYIFRHGLHLESDYPLEAELNYCRTDKLVASISIFMKFQHGKEKVHVVDFYFKNNPTWSEMKEALKYGPIVLGICESAIETDFNFKDIYKDKSSRVPDHVVLAVSWGCKEGDTYIRIQSSHGRSYGDKGEVMVYVDDTTNTLAIKSWFAQPIFCNNYDKWVKNQINVDNLVWPYEKK